MIVGSIDETGQFVPMLEMLENLYRLVTITKATASNKEDLRRELGKIEQAPGVGAINTHKGGRFVVPIRDGISRSDTGGMWRGRGWHGEGLSLDGAGKTRSRAACGLGYPLRW